MKQLLISLIFATFLFTACQDDEDDITLSETGTVVDYAGSGNCGIVIELDNGGRIQPLYYPDEFTFAEGQRVLVEYSELTNVISACDRGTACNITYVEELSCTSYIDLYFSNYDSLARDPVYIQEAYVDGNCLQIKLSYSGGCQDHTVDLARMHPWETDSTSIPTLEIRHNANGDLCEALFTKEYRFDLTPLKEEGKTQFILTAVLANDETYSETFDLN